MKNKVKFMDDNTQAIEGISDVSIKQKHGENSLIKNVLYIQGIKCNLLSIGQLLERNYKIHMENKMLKVMDANGSLVLKVPMAQNKTFKVELKVMENISFATTTNKEEWIWHYRLGHLNFRDLKAILKINMVIRLPLINMPTEVWEECMQEKQHRGSFNKYADA